MSGGARHVDTMFEILVTAARARGRDLLEALIGVHGLTVQHGPFAGMTLPGRSSWSDDDVLPRLIGCYEAELHPLIEDIIASTPDLVMNIGAAEGYYAIGMARRLPATRVMAVDINGLALEVCREAAIANQVDDRVTTRSECDPALLQEWLSGARNPVVICDAEGAERSLIDPDLIPALARTTLIIESHDFIHAGTTETLIARLEPTHDVAVGREGGRDPNAYPSLQRFNSLDRWLVMCEYRPETMRWVHAVPRTHHPDSLA